MDPGESPEECALRELEEETGYVGKVMEGSFGVSPVMFNGMFHSLLLPVRIEGEHASCKVYPLSLRRMLSSTSGRQQARKPINPPLQTG